MNGPLTCNAENCVHNTSGLCTAKNIHINGASAHSAEYTSCSTFAQKGFKNAFTNMFNMNVGGEIRQLFNNSSIEMKPIISCDAVNCVYNMNKICEASHIQIQGLGALNFTSTSCQSFQEV